MAKNEFYLPNGDTHKVPPHPEHAEKILKERQPKTHEELAQELGVGVDVVIGAIEHLKDEGYQFVENGKTVMRTKNSPDGTIFDHTKLHDHHLHFGVISDTHLGSKKEKVDELESMYDIFESEGISVVYHAGDISEGWGVYRGQEFEVHKVGQDEQIEYVENVYPKREGITTYFITGNHDLRQTERGGVDPGIPIAKRRGDLEYMGQMTARVLLPGENELELLHPGGGGAYALSYKAQKYINNLSPEDVPEMLVFGHYHTSFYMHYRNVHFLQAPAFKGAGLWEKRLGLNPTTGGWIVDGKVSSEGNIERFKPELIKFQNERA